ncbi:PH-like domain-containing protein [Arthrobacter sp. USHLN218]|uniref:PH-like domain-containing protein n=1 Tax=Arthrobacter sp. USHLN218 TaxID=3081232 RepID=UPI003019F707
MDYLGPGLITLSLVVVLVGLVYFGWRNRLKRQQDVAPLPAVPEDLPAPVAAYEGQYVVTTTAGDWLDRLAVHSLGIRSNALLRVYPQGVLIERRGVPDLYLPAAGISGVRTESGMVGKFVEKDGLAVITWSLGGRDVDTAFRNRHAAEKRPMLEHLKSFVPAVTDNDEDLS